MLIRRVSFVVGIEQKKGHGMWITSKEVIEAFPHLISFVYWVRIFLFSSPILSLLGCRHYDKFTRFVRNTPSPFLCTPGKQ